MWKLNNKFNTVLLWRTFLVEKAFYVVIKARESMGYKDNFK